MKRTMLINGAIWMALVSLFVLTPILMLVLGPKFSERPTLLDLSISLAFTGLSIMSVQFFLTARIKPLNQPFGTDLVYHFHRQIGIAAFFMVLAHPLLLFVLDSRYLRLLNLITAPGRARAGVIAVLLLIGVVWMSEYRQKLRIPYWFWKLWHGILATIMIGLAVWHIFMAGTYINLPWKQVLWVGYSALLIAAIAYTRVVFPLKLMAKPFTVNDVRQERGDVWTVSMKPQDHPGFKFIPGQFAWLTAWKTPFSDSEHPFSLASSAENRDGIEMSIKNLGPYTSRIKDLKPGQKVFVDGPYGSFSMDRYPDAERYVFIPGGIGVTPIISMLRTMADRNDRRPVFLFYCNREWDSVTFREEIASLKTRLNLQVVYVIEKPPTGWDGEAGFLNETILKKHLNQPWFSSGTEVFLCGPVPMMKAVEKALQSAGFPEKQIHTEQFALV